MVLLATYGAIMWKLKGTTVGGLVCNLKVVRLDGQPARLEHFHRARAGLLPVDADPVPGLHLDRVRSEGRQAWHDKIAGTVVVRSPQGVSLL